MTGRDFSADVRGAIHVSQETGAKRYFAVYVQGALYGVTSDYDQMQSLCDLAKADFGHKVQPVCKVYTDRQQPEDRLH